MVWYVFLSSIFFIAKTQDSVKTQEIASYAASSFAISEKRGTKLPGRRFEGKANFAKSPAWHGQTLLETGREHRTPYTDVSLICGGESALHQRYLETETFFSFGSDETSCAAGVRCPA